MTPVPLRTSSYHPFSVGRPLQGRRPTANCASGDTARAQRPHGVSNGTHRLESSGTIGGSCADLHNIFAGLCDCYYASMNAIDSRVNIFRQRGAVAISNAAAPRPMPTMKSRAHADLKTIVCKHQEWGMVQSHGRGTGSGKKLPWRQSTDQSVQSVHIVTRGSSNSYTITQARHLQQRELGNDFEDFASGLRSARRQAPKVILVGAIRDRATVANRPHGGGDGPPRTGAPAYDQCRAGPSIVSRQVRPERAGADAHPAPRTMRLYRSLSAWARRIGGGRPADEGDHGIESRVVRPFLGESDVRSFTTIIEAQAPSAGRPSTKR